MHLNVSYITDFLIRATFKKCKNFLLLKIFKLQNKMPKAGHDQVS